MYQEIIVKKNEKRILPILWLGEETEINYQISLAKRGAQIELYFLLIGKDNHKLDLTVNVDHLSPNTISKIIVKGVITDSSAINFNGLTKINKGAYGVNAWLSANFLLLSDKARAKAIPGLEIVENDVKAGHATTIGKVNDLELFYLMSRGLSKSKAEQLIVKGFFNGMLAQFPLQLRRQAESALKTI
jgi:Fe-S cluster assembly scaffold protein SufB